MSENIRNTREEIIINVQTSIQPTQWLGKMACSVEIRVSLTDKGGNCYMQPQVFSAYKSTASVRAPVFYTFTTNQILGDFSNNLVLLLQRGAFYFQGVDVYRCKTSAILSCLLLANLLNNQFQ